MQNYRQNNRPHVTIPPGARPPVNPSPAAVYSPYAFEVTPPNHPQSDFINPWDENATPVTARPRDLPPRSRTRTASVFESGSGVMAFPEPELYRSSSQRSTLSPNVGHNLRHRASNSDFGPASSSLGRIHRDLSSTSLASFASSSSYHPTDDFEAEVRLLFLLM